MRRRACLLVLLSAAAAAPAAADFKFEGYGDVRLVLPSGDDETWLEGGLAKTRFARADGDREVRAGEIVGEAIWQATPDIMVFGSLRYDEDQRTPIDLIETYARYRPVSTSAWRWSVKAGAFFPPVSLENDEVGWTSRWTLTPSALNTWVGEELRTIGAEAKLELRGTVDTFEANAAVFGWNDPAGILLDTRGWALGDRPTGLFDKPRQPDALAIAWGAPVPMTTPMFKEIDDRPGWYARLAWLREGLRVEVLRYDNSADPAAYDEQFAWRTEFWSAGLEAALGDFTFVAQGMTGETEVIPSATYDRIVKFWSAFALLGRAWGDWRVAARAELFGSDATRYYFDMGDYEGEDAPNYGEHGHAFTLAAAWLPEDWLRLSAELLIVDSYRPERRLAGLDPDSVESQFQLGARFYF